MILERNPGLRVLPFDTDSQMAMKLCELPDRGDPQRTQRFSVPEKVAELLEYFDGARATPEAIQEFQAEHGVGHTSEQLNRLVSDFLLPRAFLIPQGQVHPIAEDRPVKRRTFLHLRVPLLGQPIVTYVSMRLQVLFHPLPVLAILISALGAHIYFFAKVWPSGGIDTKAISTGMVGAVMLLSTVGTMFHEFGHTSAAARFGCRNLSIGWGVYYLMTVFYSDVSEAWRLPRYQRAVVDLGGLYAQSVFQILCLGMYLATGHRTFVLSFFFTCLSMASSLNPFLRLDGYWLISDLFGIANLRQQSIVLFKQALGRFSRSRPNSGVALQLKRPALIGLGAYLVFSSAFFGYMFWVLFDHVILDMVFSYPSAVQALSNAFSSSSSSLWTVGERFLSLAWRTVGLAGIAIFLSRFVAGAARVLTRWLLNERARFRAAPC